ncbi:MAG: hypothetical protein WCK85_05945 [Chlorobium sp.]
MPALFRPPVVNGTDGRSDFLNVMMIVPYLHAKAFRAELAEPDPNDEPAEELLKRILKEKAKPLHH